MPKTRWEDCQRKEKREVEGEERGRVECVLCMSVVVGVGDGRDERCGRYGTVQYSTVEEKTERGEGPVLSCPVQSASRASGPCSHHGHSLQPTVHFSSIFLPSPSLQIENRL